MTILAALILILAFAMAPAVMAWRRRPVARLRAVTSRPGKPVQLPQGACWCHWHGAGHDGPVVVMIHGLASAGYSFDALAPLLAARGARVLVYDLYGRGLSDRPFGRQDRAFFNRQLRDLLNAQGLSGPVTLLGYSLGGGIATAFASAHPDRVAGLILCAPAGFGDTPSRFSDVTRRWPVLGDWLAQMRGDEEFRGRIGKGPASAVPDMEALQRNETGTRGYLRAILSTRRHMLTERLAPEHRGLAARGMPVLALWAGADRVVPLAGRDALALANPRARQQVIPEVGHGFVHTHPQAVAAPVLDWMGLSAGARAGSAQAGRT